MVPNLQTCSSDDRPDLKFYDDLVALVKDFHDSRPSVIVTRYKFNSQEFNQLRRVLRRMLPYCDYTDTLPLMLRDRLVCGVNQSGIQKRLLAEKDLTFDEALDIAKALEAAEKDTQDLKSDSTVRRLSFHFTSQTRGRCYKTTTDTTSHQEPYYRCGGAHSPS